jgi:hypothetical protein
MIPGNYPTMVPHEGCDYLVGGKKSLLLIGESHYLPKDSTHLKAEEWYSADHSTLTPKEIDYISTAEIIRDARATGFKNKAYSIYRNAFKVINQNGPKHADFGAVADDVVFYNYFQRPAKHGKSLDVCEQDIEIADERFHQIYAEYRPALVVFLSMLARRYCASCRSIDPDKVVATPHPGSRYWNQPAKKYGNKSGREILANAVKTLWSQSTG